MSVKELYSEIIEFGGCLAWLDQELKDIAGSVYLFENHREALSYVLKGIIHGELMLTLMDDPFESYFNVVGMASEHRAYIKNEFTKKVQTKLFKNLPCPEKQTNEELRLHFEGLEDRIINQVPGYEAGLTPRGLDCYILDIVFNQESDQCHYNQIGYL